MGAGAVSSGEYMELLQVWGRSLATTGSPQGQASSWAGRAGPGGWFFALFFPEGELILTEQTKKEGSANETQMNLGWLRGC